MRNPRVGPVEFALLTLILNFSLSFSSDFFRSYFNHSLHVFHFWFIWIITTGWNRFEKTKRTFIGASRLLFSLSTSSPLSQLHNIHLKIACLFSFIVCEFYLKMVAKTTSPSSSQYSLLVDQKIHRNRGVY